MRRHVRVIMFLASLLLFVAACVDDNTEEPPEPVMVWKQVESDVMGTNLTVAPDGSIYVAGFSGYTFNGGDFGVYESIWIGKFTSEGVLVWSKTLPNVALSPTGIAATSDSGFVLTLEEYTFIPEKRGVTRYDGDGEPLWTLHTEGCPQAVAVDSDDTILIGSGSDDGLASVTAITGDGTLLWSTSYGDPEMKSSVEDIAIGPEGGIYLAGRMGIAPHSTRSRAWLHRAADDGTPEWDLLLSDGIATDSVSAVDVTPSGIALALIRTPDKVSVTAFDPAGTELWSSNPSVNNGTRLVATSDAGFALTDFKLIHTKGQKCISAGILSSCESHLRVARSDSDGPMSWFTIDPTCDRGQDLAITVENRVILLTGCPSESTTTVATELRLYDNP